jgi:hypothetical protein
MKTILKIKLSQETVKKTKNLSVLGSLTSIAVLVNIDSHNGLAVLSHIAIKIP